MDRLIESIKALSQLPILRQLGFLVGLALSIAIGVGIVSWSQSPDYRVLFGSLDNKNAGQVTQALDAMGERYRIEPGTGLITVPAGKVHQLRLKLASEGMPGSSNPGFDILYEEQTIGTSNFIEKARFHRALEEELATSIQSLDVVRAARVHLAIPKQSAFVRNRDKANASVLVNLHPGRSLNEDQLAGMIYLVAASVPNLAPEDVTLVDQRGRLLSKQTSSGDLLAGAAQNRFTREVEMKFVASIMNILSPILGADGVRAQVVADLDFVSIDRTSENYDPNSISLRSEQTVEEKGSSNAPSETSPTPGDELDADSTSEPVKIVQLDRTVRATRNYEVDRTISHIKEQPGRIKKLSVALVVDYRKQLRADGSIERLQLTEVEIQQIVNLAKEAVGFNTDRGDSINLVNAPFLETTRPEEIIETPFWQQAWLQSIGKQLIGLLGIIFLVFGVLRPLLNRLTAEGSRIAKQAAPVLVGADGGGIEVGNDHITLSGQVAGDALQLPGYDQQLIGARNLVRQDPSKVAQVIKGWVQADG